MGPDVRLEELEDRLGYKFADRSLLARALVHRSLVNETDLKDTDSNERLEFLGDAALELVATTYLYHRHPDRLEGELSAARASLVNLRALARRAETLDLAEFVSTGAGDILRGGRSRSTVIGRSFEAVIGAIFLDGGLPGVEGLLLPWFDEYFESYKFSELDNKSRLQHLIQARGGQSPAYRHLESSGPEHAKLFRVEVDAAGKVLAVGEGTSLQRAELDAAGRALAELNRDQGAGAEQVSD